MTICDIAKMAGVSATTVSRVINNKGYVKAEIREKIERLIQEHHYRPSAVACGLIRNNTEMIAVDPAGRERAIFVNILDAIDIRVDKEIHGVLLYNASEDPEKEYQAILQALDHRVQGILMLPVIETE